MMMQSTSLAGGGAGDDVGALGTPSREVLARLGTTWRESAKVVGRSVCSTAIS